MKKAGWANGIVILAALTGLLLTTVGETVANAAKSAHIGTVAAVRGDASATNTAGEAHKLKVGSQLFIGDVIRTAARGRVRIALLDETVIALGRNAELVLSDFEYAPADKRGKVITEVRQGAFRVIGGAIANMTAAKFETKTPVGTIGIRGTDYVAVASADSLRVVLMDP